MGDRGIGWARGSSRAAIVLGLSLLAACGGGGSGGGSESPPLDVPTTGSVTIPPATRIDRIDIGDAQQVIDVMPGDRLALRLFIAHRDAADQYDVTVLEGTSIVRAVREGERWLLEIDARALAAGTSHAYRLQIRHRPSGAVAELRAPLRVATPTVRAAGTIGADGGTLNADDGSLRLSFDAASGAAPLGVQLLAADGARGRSWRIVFDRDVSAETRPVRIEPFAVATASATATARPAAPAPLPDFTAWQTTIGSFTTAGGYRLPDDKLSIGLLSGFTCALATLLPSAGGRICIDSAPASMLSGKLQRLAPQLGATEPVLFVHGYQISPLFHLLGGDGWGQFPDLVEGVQLWDETRSARSFMFQWATNASFAQVARELAAAVVTLRNATGRPVTIVAHSFGGVLVRSMLQLHATTAEGAVAQVVTLGAPHSGVMSIAGTVDGILLPRGFDDTAGGSLAALCDQISCFEMGGARIAERADAALGFAALVAGHWSASLAKVERDGGAPVVPLVVGIGLGLLGNGPAVVGGGDGLISFAGQRYLPGREADPATGTAPLLDCDPAARPQVREVVMSANGLLPGAFAAPGARGLVHTFTQRGDYSLLLPHEKEAEVDSTTALSFQEVARVLRAGVCPLAPDITNEPLDVAVVAGQPASFAVAVSGRPTPRVRWQRDGGDLAGATGTTYRIDAVMASDDGALFRAIVENPAGQVTTREARLTVLAGPPVPVETGPAKGRLANCARPCVLAATADGRLFGAGTDPDADGFHALGSPGVAAGPWFPLSSSLPAVRVVSSGSGSSMLAGTDGSLWVTGNGSFGRLGDGAIGSDTWKPVGGINDVRAVVGRGIASYAITGSGQLWMAGANTEGQAGYLLPPGQSFVTSWARVPTIPDATRVDSNGLHTLVLRSDRTVWAAGQNSRGSESMLGFGAGGSVLNIREWRQVPGLANIVDVATGASHSMALTEGGHIWAVGDAPSGTFSSFGWTPQLAFAEVPGIADVQSIVAGNFCSMAIKTDGSLWVAGLFGVGATGAGAGAPINYATWTRIAAAPPLSAVQTDCARSLAIGLDGALYVAGANELGGIGLGNPQTTAGVPRETLVWTPIPSLGTGF